VHYDDEAGTGFCNRTEFVEARFVAGRWVASDGGEVAEVVVDSGSPGECVSSPR
jgi:hypothetical protein